MDVQIPLMHALLADAMDCTRLDRFRDLRGGDLDRRQQRHGGFFHADARADARHSE